MKREVRHQVIWNVGEMVKGAAIIMSLPTIVYFVEISLRGETARVMFISIIKCGCYVCRGMYVHVKKKKAESLNRRKTQINHKRKGLYI